jgi:hypothetical protein
MDMRLADLVQGVGSGDENLLRRAAPVGAGPAEIARLDHDHPHPGSSRWHRDAEGAVAAADDQNVARFAFHLASPSSTPAAPAWFQPSGLSGRARSDAKHNAARSNTIRRDGREGA